MFLKKKKSMQSIKARKYDKLLVFLYKQIDVCYRIMCYAFTECAYYNHFLKEQNVFFSDVNLFMELLMTQRQFLQAIEVN